jgi:hypothetical protein
MSALAGEALSVELRTPAGNITLPAASLDGLAAWYAEEYTVSLRSGDDGTIRLEFLAGDRRVETLSGGLLAVLPAKDAAPGTVLLLVGKDGTETPVKKTALTKGAVSVRLEGSATVKIAERSIRFTDTGSHWAREGIDFVSARGLMIGMTEDCFAPDAPMTRAMLATVLFRLEDARAVGSSPFDDVPEDSWYTDAVIWASSRGIVTGTGSGFAPMENITREQMVTMLYNYAGAIGMDTGASKDLGSFPDSAEVHSWAADAMGWAVAVGLVNGRDGALAPADFATRAEVATILQRLIAWMVG